MIQVSCAIVEKEGKILAALRSITMDRGGTWEFPGGKVKCGEQPITAIIREIREELGIAIQPIEQLPTVTHDYGDKIIQLIPFRCHWISGQIVLMEHEAIQWLKPEALYHLNWCEADAIIINQLFPKHSK